MRSERRQSKVAETKSSDPQRTPPSAKRSNPSELRGSAGDERLSGWENEHFTNWPGQDGRFDGADWRWKFDVARWLAVRKVPLLAVTYGPARDRVGQTYHRATWLLSWNGSTGASVYVPDETASSRWLSAATKSIGRPVGPAVEAADGTWTRKFTRGVVAVNPTTQARRVLGVRLAPTTATIRIR
jgi:hypothetical protein